MRWLVLVGLILVGVPGIIIGLVGAGPFWDMSVMVLDAMLTLVLGVVGMIR